MPKSLKLVGPKTYNLSGTLSRAMQRGETVHNVPDDVADRLLSKGHGDAESDDFKPYFKEVRAQKGDDDDAGGKVAHRATRPAKSTGGRQRKAASSAD